jgi:hypothetical protein
LISPVAPPVDSTLFEEPQDAGQIHYLPGYVLATQGLGGAQTKRVSFAPNAQGFMLTANLRITPGPANGTAIQPTTRYLLTGMDGGQSASWDFGTATPQVNGLQLQLTVTSLADRDSIYRIMTTPAAGAQLIVRRSFAVASPVPPTPEQTTQLYQLGNPTIDTVIPFTFDPNLDRNVFVGLGGMASSGPGSLTTTSLSWKQRSYPYYQNQNEPDLVYFLPDGFKISRTDTAPYAPSISIASTGSDPANQQYVLSFLAVPVWDVQRIQDATQKLQVTLGLGQAPTMSLYEAANTSLALNLPASDGSVAGLSAVAGATIDVGAGVSASVTLSLAQLQQVYSALFDSVSTLLSGVVTVTVGNPSTGDVEKLSLSARASEFAGKRFDVCSAIDSSFPRITQILTNAIESPIQVRALTGQIMKPDGSIVPAVAQQAWPQLPVTLQPGAGSSASSANGSTVAANSSTGNDQQNNKGGGFGSVLGNLLTGIVSGLTHQPPPVSAGFQPKTPPNAIAFAIAVAQGVQLDSASTVSYDYSGVAVLADPNAIWDAIMQNQVLSPLVRSVQIMAFSSIFAAPASPAASTTGTTTAATAASPLRALQVIFESGQTANFDPSTPANNGVLTHTVALTLPIKAYVLHQGDMSTYRYRINQIYDSGATLSDWVSSNQDSFYAEVSS